MSIQKVLAKWIMWIVGGLLLLSVATVLFINNELDKMYGGRTEEVDASSFLTEAQEYIVIANANILSSAGDSMLLGKSVLIKNGVIEFVGDSISDTKKGMVIEGSGKYLIPGLVDAHIHLWQSPNDLLLYLANGITTVREMKGREHHLEWRDEIASGNRPGPQLIVTTSKFQSKGFFAGAFLHWTQGDIILNDPAKAKPVVEEFRVKGYDAVKIGSFLSEESYLAMSAAGDELAMPVVGHIPLSADLQKLWTSSQSDVSHIEEFVKKLYQEFGRIGDKHKEFLAHVKGRGKTIAQQLVANDISITVTLDLMESIVRQKSQVNEALEEVSLEYVNPGLLEGTFIAKGALGWLPGVNRYSLTSDATEEEKLRDLAYFKTYVAANRLLLKLFYEAGVKIMVGTDANVPTEVPAFSIHDELASMHRVGMSTSDVLRSATSIPAERLSLNAGKIAPGYRADLVLLANNPLENIEHTRTVETVITGSRVYEREQLDEMLEAVKTANNNSRKNSLEVYLTKNHRK